jgi:hypothetical protein
MNATGFALRQGISRVEINRRCHPVAGLAGLTDLHRLAIMQGCSESESQGSFQAEVAN